MFWEHQILLWCYFFLSFQINGVEMALATHDQAVALLTSSRDIHLVVFRESMEVEHHEPIVSKSLCDASGLILTPWVKSFFTIVHTE